jgi:UvrD/REP helicase N-terminal domain
MSSPDDDPAFDIEPDGDAAAYEEWAALAGEPALPPPDHPQRDFADGRASFSAIASSLTQVQVEAASHPGSILVLAGAGTGKTSTLTAAVAHRITVDGVPPHRVLAVTFTNKAAGEMAARIHAALGPDAAPHWLGTFHGLAARQLRAGPEVASLRDNFDILDADDSRRILRRIMKAMNLSSDEDEGGKRDPVKIVAGHIGKFKDLLMTPKGARSHIENRIADGNRTGASVDVAGLTMATKVYPEYQTRLREANAADFGDLLLWPTLALVNDPDYRARWAAKFDWVHADEYQDVNFAQYTWLKTLASHARRMFVVGDDDQSILEVIWNASPSRRMRGQIPCGGRCSWRTREGFAWLGFFGRATHLCPLTREVALGCPCSTILGGRRPPSTPMVAASINICASAERSALMPPMQRLSTCRYLSATSVARRNPSPIRLHRSAMRPSSSGSPPFGFGTIIWSIKDCANGILCPAVACRQRVRAPMITLDSSAAWFAASPACPRFRRTTTGFAS